LCRHKLHYSAPQTRNSVSAGFSESHAATNMVGEPVGAIPKFGHVMAKSGVLLLLALPFQNGPINNNKAANYQLI